MSVTVPSEEPLLPGQDWVSDPVRVVLCDDHALFRRALMVGLEAEGEIEVVGESDEGVEAAALVQEMAPDAVLVDLGLPPYGGVATISQMARLAPGTAVLVLAANERNPEDLVEAVGAGADAVVLKEFALDEVESRLHSLAAGHCVIPASVASVLAGLPEELDGLRLSDRERLVAEIVARGAQPSDAAGALDVDVEVAENLLVSLVRKVQRAWRHDEVLRSWGASEEDPGDTAERARRMSYELS